jgi:hypothetical protein
MAKQDGRDKASLQAGTVDVLKAWAVYYLLKCAVVISAMYIGERLGVLVLSIENGPGLQEGVETAWGALAVYYTAVAVVAALIFKWAVSRFVVSKMVREKPVRLSLFLYCRAWVVYAAITFALGYLITLVLEYTILELILGSLAEAPWTGWLRKSVGPIAFTVVSLFVFRWSVIKLLLADRTAVASPKAK